MATTDVADAQKESPTQQLDALLRQRTVRSLVGEVAGSTLWRWIEQGKFPKPVRLGDNTVAWRSRDIASWIESRQPSAAEPQRRRGGRQRSTSKRAATAPAEGTGSTTA